MSERDEELLVQAALDPAGLAAELGPDAGARFVEAHADELADLRGFLGEVRAAAIAADTSELAWSTRRVTRRVLARTTQERKGWRGDAALVADFVADRLRASGWLRVAAALLIVQCTVVPILAWHVLTARAERGVLHVSFERGPDGSEFAVPTEDLPAGPVVPPGSVASESRIAAAAVRLGAAARATAAGLDAGSFSSANLAAATGRERLVALRVLGVLDALGEAPAGSAGDPASALDLLRAAEEAAGDAAGAAEALLTRLDVALDRRLLGVPVPELNALAGDAFDLLEDPLPGTPAAAVRGRLEALGLLPPRDPSGAGPELLPSGATGAVGPLERRFAAALGSH